MSDTIIPKGTYKWADFIENFDNFVPPNINTDNGANIIFNFKSGGYSNTRILINTDSDGRITRFGYNAPQGYVWTREGGWTVSAQTFTVETSQILTEQNVVNVPLSVVTPFISSNLEFKVSFCLPEYYYYRIENVNDGDYEFQVHFTSFNQTFTKIKVKIQNSKVSQMLYYKVGSTTDYITVVHDSSGLVNTNYGQISLYDGEGNIKSTTTLCYLFLQLFKRYNFSYFDYSKNDSFFDLGGLYGLEVNFIYSHIIQNFYSFFPSSTSSFSISPILDNKIRFNETYFAFLKKNPDSKLIVSGYAYLISTDLKSINQYYYKLYTPQSVKFNPQSNILSWDKVSNADNYQLEYPNGSGHVLTENQDFLYLNGKYVLKAQSSLNFINGSDTVEVMVTNYNTNIVLGYYNSSESNRLDKLLSLQFEAACTFRNTVSVLNPVIELEMDELPKINYVFLVALHRYYYVTDITIIRNRLYALHLAVDVLMSYKDEILNLNPIIERQENNYNNLLIDDLVPVELPRRYERTEGEGLFGYRSASMEGDGGSCIVICLMALETFPSDDYTEATNITPYSNIYVIQPEVFAGVAYKLLDPSFLESVSNLFTDLSEYIVNAYICPFDPRELDSSAFVEKSEIKFGNKTITLESGYKAYLMDSTSTMAGEWYFSIDSSLGTNNYKRYKPFHLSTINPDGAEFIDYPPYREIKAFLPGIGIVDIDSYEYMDKDMHFIYFFDMTNGSFTCYVSKDYPNRAPSGSSLNTLIMYVDPRDVTQTFTGKIGYQIAIGRTNANDIYRNVSLASLALIGGTVAIGAGVGVSGAQAASMTGAKLASVEAVKGTAATVAGAHLITSSSVNIVSGLVSHYSQVQQTGDNYGSLFGNMYPVIIDSYTQTQYPVSYNSIIGRPCMRNVLLSRVNGYTKIYSVHMDGFPNATSEELNEIESILKSGIIL